MKVRTYVCELSLKDQKSFTQDILKWMLEARKTGDVIKVRYGKVLFSGSCGFGKTSFFRLLMKQQFDDKYTSTGLADAHRVIFSTKIYVQPSSSDDVEFQVLDFEKEISQLTSHVHAKAVSVLLTIPNTEHESSGPAVVNSESITEIENDIAINVDTNLIPKQSSEKIWDILTFVDTGGQPEYISMLPAVNSSVMLTFVVHKMEGGVSSLYNPVTVTHSGECHVKPYPLGYSNLDLIKTLMSFTNNIFLRKKPFLDKVCCKKGPSVSYLSFIGTYLDKVSKNDVNEINKVLTTTVNDSELKYVWGRLNTNYEYLIPIDNTTSGPTNEDKSAAKIRKEIHQLLQKQDIYEVPYIWILLELIIRKVCQERGCDFIVYTEVLELCKQKEMINYGEEFIKNGLKFHHLFGVLLYFDEVEGMENLIITNPKWLFDKLTSIVVYSYSVNFSNTEIRKDFEHKGIFNITLLEKIDLAAGFEKSGIHIEAFDIQKAFLNLLRHLKIIAPIESSTKYFMPCLLSSCDITEEQKILHNYGTNCILTTDEPNLPVEPLLLQFTLCSSSDQFGSFPRGVFCCLIVQLLQDYPKWRLQWSTSKKKVFSNLVTFMEDSGHYITLIDKLFFLEVHVTHKCKMVYGSTIHHHVLCIIMDGLHKVGQSLNFCEFKMSYGFLCHECKEPEVHMTRLSEVNHPYLLCYCNGATNVTLAHKVWFGDFSNVDCSKRSLKDSSTKQGTICSYCVYTVDLEIFV